MWATSGLDVCRVVAELSRVAGDDAGSSQMEPKQFTQAVHGVRAVALDSSQSQQTAFSELCFVSCMMRWPADVDADCIARCVARFFQHWSVQRVRQRRSLLQLYNAITTTEQKYEIHVFDCYTSYSIVYTE